MGRTLESDAFLGTDFAEESRVSFRFRRARPRRAKRVNSVPGFKTRERTTRSPRDEFVPEPRPEAPPVTRVGLAIVDESSGVAGSSRRDSRGRIAGDERQRGPPPPTALVKREVNDQARGAPRSRFRTRPAPPFHWPAFTV